MLHWSAYLGLGLIWLLSQILILRGLGECIQHLRRIEATQAIIEGTVVGTRGYLADSMNYLRDQR